MDLDREARASVFESERWRGCEESSLIEKRGLIALLLAESDMRLRFAGLVQTIIRRVAVAAVKRLDLS